MLRTTADRTLEVTDYRSEDVDLHLLVSAVACGCADAATQADAPTARALFHRVEVMKQSMDLAAQSLGIAAGDAAYLLTGLRAQVATDLVVLLSTGRSPWGARMRR